MKIRCNCGWSRELTDEEIEKISNGYKLRCNHCGKTSFKLICPLICEMEEFYYIKEKELRCHLINALFVKKGVAFWDCSSESCPDPLIVKGIPLQIKAGDFIYGYKGRIHTVELKFIKYDCQSYYSGYRPKRRTMVIYRSQFEMIKEGGGYLVVVAEPKQKEITKGKEVCIKGLSRMRGLLGTRKLTYDCVIVDKNLIYQLKEGKKWVNEKGYEVFRISFQKVWNMDAIKFQSPIHKLPHKIADYLIELSLKKEK
ncbi:MAG: hypothetical protein HWN66_05325 [Candidatus Helarchaeota archaeon]|nr:hypothetical protein [Candidatus Helarchaeota archaeon]